MRYVETPPVDIRFNTDASDLATRIGPADVEQIAELFRTPLTGAYTWDYEDSDRRIRKLYSLGKELNWNAELDVDWSVTFPKNEPPEEGPNPYEGWDAVERLSESRKTELGWHHYSWRLSQFLHGEQGALLVASQLCSCAPTYDAKLYAASQTFDEARHVEAFRRYLTEKVGFIYPVNRNLKALLDKILTDERWDLKFIGMQLIIEGLALAAFQTMLITSRDPLLKRIIELIMRDESRHVGFGVIYMEQFVKALPPAQIEERAEFAYEACVVMRERLVGGEPLAHFGIDPEEGRRRILAGEIVAAFRKLLFTRIMPNLKRVGLLTDAVRPRYEALGILEFENLVDDGAIDWAKLAEPLG